MRRPAVIGVVIGLVCVGSGFAAGWFSHPTPVFSSSLSLRQSDLASTTYRFIDPLLAVRNPDAGNSPNYAPLMSQLNGLIADAQQKQTAQTVSVYFRDMGPSQGFVINGSEQYNPASLLKVPTLMSYLKFAEDDPNALGSYATYTGATDANAQEHIRSSVQLPPGSYTVNTLLEHMIKNSDNNAAETLISHLNAIGGAESFDKLFNDLGVSQVDLSNDFITVRAYALFFRVLYNATYLNRDNSEEALRLLSQTDFTQGLRMGVPEGTDVAHKFGEFSLQDQHGALLKRELHDCGIVYYPNHPYLLCVMTKGDDFLALENLISNISADSYQFVFNKYH